MNVSIRLVLQSLSEVLDRFYFMMIILCLNNDPLLRINQEGSYVQQLRHTLIVCVGFTASVDPYDLSMFSSQLSARDAALQGHTQLSSEDFNRTVSPLM